MDRLYVGSEIGRLRRVIIHRPKRSLNHLTPSNCQELLFDDVLSVERAGLEHDLFAKTLQEQHVEVLHLSKLLSETLANSEAKKWLLDQQITEQRLGTTLAIEVRGYLCELEDTQLANILTGGLAYGQLPIISYSLLQQIKQPLDFIIEPLPNHLFTRDTSCWIYGGVSINPMAKLARRRETNHLRAIYRWHPLFAKQDYVKYYGDDEKVNYDLSSIEGGDVMVLGRGTVLMGMSERTTPQGVEHLARALFKHQQATQVIALKLPEHRSCMHLDTVLTHMHEDTFSLYPKIINKHTDCWSLTADRHGDIQIKKLDNLFTSITRALDLDQLNFISTGGDNFNAEREQWNDANNVLAVRPGVVIGYSGNTYTNEKYEKAGIKVLTIAGDELGRGRGGARCMSCPIERDDI